MDHIYSYHFDYVDISRVENIDLKEYVKSKAAGELAQLLIERAEVQEEPWANRIVVKISV